MPPDSVGNDLTKFETAMERAKVEPGYAAFAALANIKEHAPTEQYPPFRLGVLRNFTFEPVLPAIEAQLLLAGRQPITYVADFDTTATEALDPNSGLYGNNPDAVIIANWLDSISPQLALSFPKMTAAEVDEEIDRLCQEAVTVLSAIRRNSTAPLLINNYPLTGQPALGILDAQDAAQQSGAIIRLNHALLEATKDITDVYWVDYFNLFAGHGYRRAMDERHWSMARAPLGRDVLAPLAEHYGAFFKALIGQVRKCLVLDCDGTLWGGVIGEDGMDGIRIGDQHPGAAFQAFQREILNLRARGVILAICSKNNEADVLEVMRDHPGMLLREEHFVSMQINWDDKPTNLRRIAEELNIGTDALVFVDDTAFECDFVRQSMPEVAVLHLNGDATGFRSLLTERAYFDTLTYSSEDAKRSDMMVAERTRKNLAASATSVEDYLRSLDIQAEIGVPGPREIGRVAQLTQKTNQFNLTTQRYTEGDIERFLNDADTNVYCLKLRDKVADIGLTGVVITKITDNATSMIIDTFLMSCRALGRGAEDALLAQVVADAGIKGVETINGIYAPTKKNGQVETFFAKRGFTQAAKDDDTVQWQLATGSAAIETPDWIGVKANQSDDTQE